MRSTANEQTIDGFDTAGLQTIRKRSPAGHRDVGEPGSARRYRRPLTARVTRLAAPLALSALLAACAAPGSDGGAGGAGGAGPIAGLARGEPLADAHFHASNYAVQGISLRGFIDRYLARSEGGLVRSVIMPLPLQQRWDSFEDYQVRQGNGQLAGPNYYIGPRAELYYYAFVDALYAKEYLALPRRDQDRLDLMITGFNPMDVYASQHIRRAVLTFPGAFAGIGEFTIHKEVVSRKLAGDPVEQNLAPGRTLPPDVEPGGTMSLYADSVARVLRTAAEIGLVVTLHNDIYLAEVDDGGKVERLHPERTYEDGLKTLCRRAPEAAVIWAHTGLGRFVKPTADHLAIVARVLEACPNWTVDVSWDLVQETITKPAAGMPSTDDWRRFMARYQDRILWGSDTVIHGRNRFSSPDQPAGGSVEAGALMTPEKYFTDAAVLQAFLNTLPAAAARKIRHDNYVRVFDGARARVRAWERAHADSDVWDLRTEAAPPAPAMAPSSPSMVPSSPSMTPPSPAMVPSSPARSPAERQRRGAPLEPAR